MCNGVERKAIDEMNHVQKYQIDGDFECSKKTISSWQLQIWKIMDRDDFKFKFVDSCISVNDTHTSKNIFDCIDISLIDRKLSMNQAKNHLIEWLK